MIHSLQKSSEKKKLPRLWILKIFNYIKTQKQWDPLKKEKQRVTREKRALQQEVPFTTMIFEKQENLNSSEW